jgi:hypothetical protein
MSFAKVKVAMGVWLEVGEGIEMCDADGCLKVMTSDSGDFETDSDGERICHECQGKGHGNFEPEGEQP